MSVQRIYPFSFVLLGALLLAAGDSPAQDTRPAEAGDPAAVQTTAAEPVPAAQTPAGPAGGQASQPELSFAFDRAPWRSVFEWLAAEADLALHVSDLPQGTFTYEDPTLYTANAAIERINLFLIPEGYSIVRSERLLAVINLNESRSLQQLDAMARMVPTDELSELGAYDVVKCLLPLGKLSPAEAAAEVKSMQLMTEPVVLPSSNQLLMTDTVGKIRAVQAVLQAMSSSESASRPVVRTLSLQHLTLDEFLSVARPHLGIQEGSRGNDQLSLSTDDSGRRLFVSGTPEAVDLLSGLLKEVDQPVMLAEAEDMEPQLLQSHLVRDQNLTSVYAVLQTLLADRPIRLSMESSTNSIVALADRETHEKIRETIDELAGAQSEFAIVSLRTLDPYFAITLLDEMFDVTAQRASGEPNALRIDADPTSMRLFIRGTSDKVAEIRNVLEDLDGNSQSRGTRVVPLFGQRAQRVLELASASWDGSNPLTNEPAATGVQTNIIERVVQSDRSTARPDANSGLPPSPVRQASQESTNESPLHQAGFISTPANLGEAAHARKQPIGAQVTPRGIVLQSEDEQALEQFESLLRSVASNNSGTTVQTVVYYLKYSTADDATRLLADLLDGATSIIDSTSGSTLVNGNVEPPLPSSWLGSYLRSNDGGTMVSSGTLTVIADSRLNRLICIGTEDDIRLVDQYLEVIDKDASLTEIKTRGQSHVIELQHTTAADMSEVLRDAYGERIGLTSKDRLAQQARQAAAKEKDGGKGQNTMQTSTSQEPQMTVAVHEQSNALVITAPDALYTEVEALVRKLDEQAAQAVEVIYYPHVEGLENLKDALTGGRRSR